MNQILNIEDLEIGNEYSNQDIRTVFKCSPQGGMRRSHQTNTLVLIADHITRSPYHDRWCGGIMYYTGMGLTGDQDLEWAQNKTLNKSNCCGSDSYGINIHFFEKFSKKYTYQGRVVLAKKPFQECQDDESGNSRKVYIFPLKKLDTFSS